MTTPTHDELPALLKQITEKSSALLTRFGERPVPLGTWLEPWTEWCRNVTALNSVLLASPVDLATAPVEFWSDAASLWQKQISCWAEGKPIHVEDPRFAGEHWLENPWFSAISQFYLLYSEHLTRLVEHIPVGDAKLAKRLTFFVRQFLEAISPSNFLNTNPELLAETIRSHGMNLLRGLENFLDDLDTDSASLVIRMTDMNAFEIGKTLATTPGEVIFRNALIELIQYTPQTPRVKAVPLLVIPPWINKYYVLDLSAHNSLIGWLVAQGITVFAISWVNPDASLADKGLQDYLLEGPVQALDVITRQLGVSRVNTLGFCIGGTLLAMLLAWLSANHVETVASATFLATLVDFSDPGDIGVYIDEEQLVAIEAKMHAKGFLDGRFMANAFNSLRANDLVWSFFIKNYLQGHAQAPFDILYWNADWTNMPAKMHSEYLRWMYLHNDLVKPGKIHCGGTPLDISAITTPSFFVATEKDHIAPWRSVWKGFELFHGRNRFLLGGSGHIAGIINPPDSGKYHYRKNQHAAPTPDDWLESATRMEGSWWPEWLRWLKSRSGHSIKAPVLKSLPYVPIMPAPGTYVMRRDNGR